MPNVSKNLSESLTKEHTKDSDCTVDPTTDCCTICGVHHWEPCRLCAGRGFHKADCVLGESDYIDSGDAIEALAALQAELQTERLALSGARELNDELKRRCDSLAAFAHRWDSDVCDCDDSDRKAGTLCQFCASRVALGLDAVQS